MDHGRHTLRTTHGSYILECTHVRGPVPSLITGHGQDLHPRNRRPWLTVISPKEWHAMAISFSGTVTSPKQTGQRLSSAHTQSRPAAW